MLPPASSPPLLPLLLLPLLLLLLLLPPALAIVLDGRTAHHAYDGHGGLSAGASSRLLRDYPQAQRNDILDALFLPQHAASLHMLKVEIPGDAQSTDGSEPSHMHTRDEAPACGRGNEIWLIGEAKRRNAMVRTYGLSWAAPRWVGDGSGDGTGFHSGDMLKYQIAWLECVRNVTGVTVDALGTWNEKPYGGSDYTVALRGALDAAGFGSTRIVIPDNGWGLQHEIVAEAAANASFRDAFAAIGLHYPCDTPEPGVEAVIGKAYWVSPTATRHRLLATESTPRTNSRARAAGERGLLDAE